MCASHLKCSVYKYSHSFVNLFQSEVRELAGKTVPPHLRLFFVFFLNMVSAIVVFGKSTILFDFLMWIWQNIRREGKCRSGQ